MVPEGEIHLAKDISALGESGAPKPQHFKLHCSMLDLANKLHETSAWEVPCFINPHRKQPIT